MDESTLKLAAAFLAPIVTLTLIDARPDKIISFFSLEAGAESNVVQASSIADPAVDDDLSDAFGLEAAVGFILDRFEP